MTEPTKKIDTTSELPTVDSLDYEAARDELMQTVRQLEQGGLSLDSSLELWERGEKLAQHCENLLQGAHQRIENTLQKKDDAVIDDDGMGPSETEESDN